MSKGRLQIEEARGKAIDIFVGARVTLKLKVGTRAKTDAEEVEDDEKAVKKMKWKMESPKKALNIPV